MIASQDHEGYILRLDPDEMLTVRLALEREAIKPPSSVSLVLARPLAEQLKGCGRA